ncbi:MAG TPA: ATP-binding protein [Candidatus Krumholzibacteria bacterium]|nr:ATP-binding protein [Candidatus Krumholzibacteria bacterium]
MARCRRRAWTIARAMFYSHAMPPRKPDSPDLHALIKELEQENAALRRGLETLHHAQDRLRDTEQRLREVIDHAPIVVFAIDAGGVFTLSEGRGLQALGLEPGQVVGMSAFEVYSDFPQIVKNLRACLEGHLINDVVEVKTLVFESLYVPRRDASGRIVGVSGVAWNVTARVRAEEMARDLEAQLRQSQKMETVGTLAGGIAHDFNNILSPILGYADLALLDIPPGHPARDDIEQVMKAARRARGLVEQILIFSRRSDQVMRPVQLHLVVNEALKLIRSMLPSSIELSQRIEKEGDTVLADAGQMHQVVMNLTTNAVHAMRNTGGVLRVVLGHREIDAGTAEKLGDLVPGSYVVLSVIDHGEGMDADTRNRVFEPFFTTKRPGEGTGLGLSVVHGIMHSHGGAIDVQSEPGKGSTFTVYIPSAPARAETEAPAEISEAGGGGEHVLIVDDEPAIVALLRRMLETRGFRVSSFTSSRDALAAFRREPDAFDAVITDQTMPRMSGLELTRAMHDIRGDIPVILSTGYLDGVAENEAGHDLAGVATKPFDTATIVGLLRKALDRA